MNLGIDIMLEKLWNLLGLVRVYTKKRGALPDFSDPLILTNGRHGCSVKAAIMQIHKALLKDMAYCYVWGRSVKHSP
jgi:ribosome-interacting GTPase 1